MPRVLRLLNRLAVGGPVLNATYLTKYLSPEFETLLVVGEKEGHEKDASYLTHQLGIEYVTIPGMGRSVNPVSDFGAYQRVKKLIRDFRPHIVHTHAAKPGAIGRLAASSMKVPVILHTFHGHVFHSYFNSFKTKAFIEAERFLARKSDAIIAISAQQKKELVEDFKIAPEGKFRVVPLGFDLDKFQFNQDEKRKRFRLEFGLSDDEVAIGIIGRLVPVKNHPLFLQAIRYALDHTHKKIKAFIIGDGETRKSLEALANELSMGFTTEKDHTHEQPIIFTSWRSDVDVINAGLDIICLTSFNEGTPVSLIEAQAANKPVVSTKVGGIADIVDENRTGLLSDIDDPDAFCKNLLTIINDEDLRRLLSSHSSHLISQRFSYQRLVTDMSHLYHELLYNAHK